MKIISILEESIITILMIILVILTFVNVILRYIFNYSISGSVEISILLFAWIIFIGSSMAIKKNNHIAVVVLESILPKKAKKYLSSLITIVLVTFSVVMCFYGFIFTFDVLGETLGASNIPKSLVYLSFPIGFGFMAIRFTYQLVNSFKERRGE